MATQQAAGSLCSDLVQFRHFRWRMDRDVALTASTRGVWGWWLRRCCAVLCVLAAVKTSGTSAAAAAAAACCGCDCARVALYPSVATEIRAKQTRRRLHCGRVGGRVWCKRLLTYWLARSCCIAASQADTLGSCWLITNDPSLVDSEGA